MQGRQTIPMATDSNDYMRGARSGCSDDEQRRWAWLPGYLVEKARERAHRERLTLRKWLVKIIERELRKKGRRGDSENCNGERSQKNIPAHYTVETK